MAISRTLDNSPRPVYINYIPVPLDQVLYRLRDKVVKPIGYGDGGGNWGDEFEVRSVEKQIAEKQNALNILIDHINSQY